MNAAFFEEVIKKKTVQHEGNFERKTDKLSQKTPHHQSVDLQRDLYDRLSA